MSKPHFRFTGEKLREIADNAKSIPLATVRMVPELCEEVAKLMLWIEDTRYAHQSAVPTRCTHVSTLTPPVAGYVVYAYFECEEVDLWWGEPDHEDPGSFAGLDGTQFIWPLDWPHWLTPEFLAAVGVEVVD